MATILMVAITVVVAATIFVISRQLGVGTDAPGALTFRINDAQDEVTVISTSNDLDWQDIEVRLNEDGAWSLEGGPVQDAPAGVWQRAGRGAVFAGQSFSLCMDTTGPAIFEVRYRDPGLGINKLTLGEVGAC